MAEPTLYAPLLERRDGAVRIRFADGHPGATDPVYVRHREHIAELALAYRAGDPVPHVPYLPDEDRMWGPVLDRLEQAHARYACAAFRDGLAELELPRDRVPQLGEVSDTLASKTGFRFAPAPGFVSAHLFYGSLESGVFHATQYLRHRSSPLFSPEPDMIHEVVGHGSVLADKRLADVYQQVGAAVNRATDDRAIDLIGKVFWYCLESGLVREGGETRILGASLLSSPGEMENFMRVEHRPLDIREMVSAPYDPANFQSLFFVADSINHIEEFILDFLSRVDDDLFERLAIA